MAPARGGRSWAHGRGRVLAPGDLRPLIISLVAEQPRYGYELMKAIEEMFGGSYTPSPGSIYPTLTLLEETGLLEGAADATGKRRYELTRIGRAHLEENRERVTGVRRRVELAARMMAGRRPPEAIFQAMQTLKTVLAMHGGDWTDAEVARVTGLIEGAANQIGAGSR